uniref:Uncharacterized protein n=1 Tax=Utricularia reniformis TaxID=192314 RepID=A0A1Y0B3G9_9LAMI|nr:hypothetical protein AEK19_MT1800 [Utricularia reniformis]ART31972.1 hypothetical protein AEK19_MT1800 [Utricularia reniformis]
MILGWMRYVNSHPPFPGSCNVQPLQAPVRAMAFTSSPLPERCHY